MNYFRSLKKSCLLPVAVTPQQKLACVTAGVATFSATAVATYWCFQKVSAYEGSAPARVTKERISQRTKDSARHVVQTIFAGATCGGAATLLAYDLNMFRKQVIGTEQCCDIIKKTMWTCARMPIYGGLFVLGVALYQTRNYPPRYDNF